MKLSFRLIDGSVARSQPGNIKSLDDARRQEAQESRENRFLEDLEDIRSHLDRFVGMDGHETGVHSHTPQPPYMPKPNRLKSLLPGVTEKYEANLQKRREWGVGGDDLASDPGVVVTTSRHNRFGANAEIVFDPAVVDIKRGVRNQRLVKGVESATISYERPRSRIIEATRHGYSGVTNTREVKYSKSEDIEVYEMTVDHYSQQEAKDADSSFEVTESRRVRIEANHATGTLTYASETHAAE